MSRSARRGLRLDRSRADGRLPELLEERIASPQPTGPAPLGVRLSLAGGHGSLSLTLTRKHLTC